MAIRICRCRSAGWTAPLDPDGDKPVYVGRGTKWGNPFKVTKTRDAAACKKLYLFMVCGTRAHLPKELKSVRDYVRTHVDEIGGYNLMCWCKDGAPCHADLLLEWAGSDVALPELREKMNIAAVVWRWESGESVESLAEVFGTTPPNIEAVIRGLT